MYHQAVGALTSSLLLFSSPLALAHDGHDDHDHARLQSQPQAHDQKEGAHAVRAFKIESMTKAEISRKAAHNESIRLHGLPMPDGTTVDVEMHPFAQFGTEFQLAFCSDRGRGRSIQRVMDMSEVTILEGYVRGKKDSYVMLATQDDRIEGFIAMDGRSAKITKDRTSLETRNVIFYADDEAKPKDDPRLLGCGVVESVEDLVAKTPVDTGGLAGVVDDCHVIRISIEIDYELYNNNLNGDGLATLFYIAKLLYGFDEIVRRDLDATVELATANVWTEPDDPWTAAHGSDQLEEFIDYCLDPANDMLNIDRDATILLSGRSLEIGKAGGIGALNCHRPDRAYAVCSTMSGDFPYPIVTNHAQNGDIAHFTHEVGHLLDAIHTHAYCPPLDQCAPAEYFGECQDSQVCQRGTVMSYCSLCPGGSRNKSLGFHVRSQERIKAYLNSIDCLQRRVARVSATDDEASAYENSSTEIDVLANDYGVCTYPRILEVDFRSQHGGFFEILEGAGERGQDLIKYYPAIDFTGTDTFGYKIIDDAGSIAIAQVVVEVERAPYYTSPEYLLVDGIEQPSISRFDAHTHEFKGDFVPELQEVLKNPSSILPLPDGSVLVGDRSLEKVLEFDINGEYQGVFFEHFDLFYPEAMSYSNGNVYIMDALGGWVFKVHLDGGVGYSVFHGEGTGRDATLGSDGTLWISGSVNGNAVIGIDPESGAVRHEIFELEDVEQPGAISTAYGLLVVADIDTGMIATFDPQESGKIWTQLVSESAAAWTWLGGGLEMVRIEDPNVSYLRYAMITTSGVFEIDEFGSIREISQHGTSLVTQATAIGYREAPDRSPDINNDGCVDGADLTLVLSYFNEPASSFYKADLDLDGIIDGSDLTIVLGAWTPCP